MTRPDPDRVVVVGASAAGLTVAQELRRRGFRGKLTLIGDEEHLPYDRPPLSKQLLTGAWEADRIQLTSLDRLAELAVDVRLGCRALRLDVAQRTVSLDDGSTVAGDVVVLATGCRPRELSGRGRQLGGLHTLRTVADAQRLRAELGPGRRIVVVGAGFLGMEVAAVARTAGSEVTVVSAETPMIGAVGPAVSAAVAGLHTERGVRLLLGAAVAEIIDADGRVGGVRLADGSEVVADSVVVAIGAVPATDWLADSGLPITDGVVCDERLQAAPGVFAVGDVARWLDLRSGRLIRLEHRMHATESAAAVAASIMGAAPAYAPIPFWWSDQYTAKIQAYGWPSAQTHLWQGDLNQRKAVVLYSDGDVITGALGWNSAKQTRMARELLVAGAGLAEAGPTVLLAGSPAALR